MSLCRPEATRQTTAARPPPNISALRLRQGGQGGVHQPGQQGSCGGPRSLHRPRCLSPSIYRATDKAEETTQTTHVGQRTETLTPRIKHSTASANHEVTSTPSNKNTDTTIHRHINSRTQSTRAPALFNLREPRSGRLRGLGVFNRIKPAAIIHSLSEAVPHTVGMVLGQ